MSLFQTLEVPCPSCSAGVEYSVVYSVNADRRPDLRAEIIDGTFQRQTCGKCRASFRVEPEFNYLDVGRGQWIAAFPVSKLGEWRRWERHAHEVFEKSYGAQASAPAQAIGADLRARMTFGWAALREKLVAAERDVNDITLELCKISIVRGFEGTPLSNETELRLYDFRGDDLIMAWIVALSERPVDLLQVPRALYDEIASDTDGWRELRAEFQDAMFVDVDRLLVESL